MQAISNEQEKDPCFGRHSDGDFVAGRTFYVGMSGQPKARSRKGQAFFFFSLSLGKGLERLPYKA